MAITNLERLLDDWAMAWTSNDPETVLALFGDDYVFCHPTMGRYRMGHVRHTQRRLPRDTGDRQALFLEVEAGKIRRQSDYWDAATFMRRVGVFKERAYRRH